ncbi:hypothetical protein M752DRAFT_123654 [Aspergillus phoenicis ATCC 13157]|uniref:Uncharacterized protein n=1 Tax=Aspergillus phoenicis ATCC 13157 TaxID=1353007 RepID=A0A370PUD8_ASPPH|nr:hypothetical protein M752DRAFT_123654 [Aspergillus phoenicis ATCC 13157]
MLEEQADSGRTGKMSWMNWDESGWMWDGWMNKRKRGKRRRRKKLRKRAQQGYMKLGKEKSRDARPSRHRNGVAVKLPHLPSTSSESVPANPDFARISLFPFPRVRSSYQITWTVIKDHCNMSSRSFNVSTRVTVSCICGGLAWTGLSFDTPVRPTIPAIIRRHL